MGRPARVRDWSINERIRQLIYSKDMSIMRMGRESGIDEKDLRKYRDDESQPDRENLIKLADYFDVTVDWILRGE